MTSFQIAEWIGTLFYVVNPATSSFARIEDVPDYTLNAFPLFIITIAFEWILLYVFETDHDHDHGHHNQRQEGQLLKF